ncbi:hypothetical protein GCM10009784_29290 [Arthrobacter parietis]|uniref:Uncharacterized protein n=1 Tax=Arthrobacter parietis TaxID=271434 RepID=A0ABN3B0P4_9MICC
MSNKQAFHPHIEEVAGEAQAALCEGKAPVAAARCLHLAISNHQGMSPATERTRWDESFVASPTTESRRQ